MKVDLEKFETLVTARHEPRSLTSTTDDIAAILALASGSTCHPNIATMRLSSVVGGSATLKPIQSKGWVRESGFHYVCLSRVMLNAVDSPRLWRLDSANCMAG